MAMPHTRNSSIPTSAVIYCRVSSERQVREGSGIGSQEQRCRSYAQANGYQVMAAFGDDGVSGALLKRPGMAALLLFLRSHPPPVAVIVDDISRIARDVKTHIALRSAILAAGGVLESPSMRFEETASGEFIEMVLAASAQFGRQGNREQVLNRQKARLQQGYWTFPAPIGYQYEKSTVHKKLLVPTTLASKILGPALEAYAIGRISSQRELGFYLRDRGFYGPECRDSLHVLEQRVTRILEVLPLYAGFIEYPRWNIARVSGQHQAIITPAVLKRLEVKLANKRDGTDAEVHAHRSDARPDFPLRGFVRCAECGRVLTGCLAKGLYPRYLCYAQGSCSRYGWSYSARLIEPAFEQLLQQVEPQAELWEVVRVMAREAWQRRLKNWERERKSHEAAVASKHEEIAIIVRRLAKTTDDQIAEELEKEIRKLRREGNEMALELETYRQQPPDFDAAFERVSTLVRYPYIAWKNGSLNQKKAIHRLVFTVAPTFDRNLGFSTYELSLLYQIFAQYRDQHSRLVEVARETWHIVASEILQLDLSGNELIG